jgi:hypothetical protein
MSRPHDTKGQLAGHPVNDLAIRQQDQPPGLGQYGHQLARRASLAQPMGAKLDRIPWCDGRRVAVDPRGLFGPDVQEPASRPCPLAIVRVCLVAARWPLLPSETGRLAGYAGFPSRRQQACSVRADPDRHGAAWLIATALASDPAVTGVSPVQTAKFICSAFAHSSYSLRQIAPSEDRHQIMKGSKGRSGASISILKCRLQGRCSHQNPYDNRTSVTSSR